MKTRKILLSILVIASAILFELSSAETTQLKQVLGLVEISSEEVVVSRVVDGDTIELSSGQKVRYIGIDTPETKHPTKGVECFGEIAAEYNTQLVEGKTVTLEKDVNETDRYGRLLRYVYLDGEMINLKLVKDGYAVASSYPPDGKYQEMLDAAEISAREQQLGLWGACPLEN